MWTESSFRKLYAEHCGRVRTTVRRRGVPERDVEDVVQEVFAVVVRCFERYDPLLPFGPWVVTIAARKAKDYRAHGLRRFALTPSGEVEAVATAPGPEDTAVLGRAVDLLGAALVRVPRELRRVVVAVEFEGLTYVEAGEEAGLSEASVQSALRRGRRALSECLRRLTAVRPGR